MTVITKDRRSYSFFIEVVCKMNEILGKKQKIDEIFAYYHECDFFMSLFAVFHVNYDQ